MKKDKIFLEYYREVTIMKKIILILTLTFVFVSQTWALCSIDGESLCTIPERGSNMPLFQNQNATGLNSNENNGISSNSFQSSNMGTSFNRMQNQTGVKMQGSLGCQFGNCNNGNNSGFLPNQ